MTPRPQPFPREPESSPVEIVREVRALRTHVDLKFAEASARADARHEAAAARLDRIEGRIERLGERTAALEHEEPAPARPAAGAGAGGEPPEAETGLPFKHGWRSWTAVGALSVAILGGMASAFEKVGAFFLNLGHMFNSTGGH